MSSGPRLALVGTSDIAMFHVDAAREAGFSIEHVAARPGSLTVQNFAERHSIDRAWSDPIEMINASDQWDALVIASTTESVLLLLRAAISAQKPVLVEKPVAIYSRELDDVVTSSTKVLVAYNRRFYRTVGAAREFLASGSPAVVHCEIPESVRRNEEGKLVADRVRLNSVHVFDLLNHLLPGLTITHMQLIDRGRPDNGGLMLGVSARGDICSISLNWNAPANFSISIDRDGERFELRPIEIATIYRGMQETQPSQEIPIARYTPQVVERILPSPDEVNFKPGFVEQARALRDLVDGVQPSIAARLTDARIALQFAERVLDLIS